MQHAYIDCAWPLERGKHLHFAIVRKTVPTVAEIQGFRLTSVTLWNLSMTSEPSGWVLLTFGDDRSWAGNSGYDDDPTRVYRYDNFVQNHRQIKAGDFAFIRTKTQLLGIAQIERIDQQPGKKERYRCPVCDSRNLDRRSTLGDYRCSKGHVFPSPAVSYRDCVNYEAKFGTSFIPAPGALSIDELRDACPRYNRQLAMQRLDLSLLAGKLVRVSPAAEVLLQGGYIGTDEGVVNAEDGSGEYHPTNRDTRLEVLQAILRRRGQQRFRESLTRRYGRACMVSGCRLFDVVEAAHISPFRGIEDHHPENGLLLRADLHTLFDLDLLGVEPDGLGVHLNPEAISEGYASLNGLVLRCPSARRPSRRALEIRWSLYQTRLNAKGRVH